MCRLLQRLLLGGASFKLYLRWLLLLLQPCPEQCSITTTSSSTTTTTTTTTAQRACKTCTAIPCRPLPAGAAPDAGLLLGLVLLTRRVTARLSGLEAASRSALTGAGPRLQAAAAAGLPCLVAAAAAVGPGPAPGAAAELLPLRLAVYPSCMAPLSQAIAAAADERFLALPAAHAAGAMTGV